MSLFKVLLAGCVVLTTLSVFSAIRGPVAGHGAGDDLDQAIFAALEDAVLNVGKVSSEQEVSEEKIVEDRVSVSNTLHLVDYTIQNQRNSGLDGVNVTINVRFSDEPYWENMDGRRVYVGKGQGATEREAADWALADLMSKAQARIQALMECEDDEIKRDEVRFEHQAYIDSYKGEVKTVGGGSVAEMSASLYPDKGKAKCRGPIEARGRGLAESHAEALSRAREEAIRQLGATYRTWETYCDGSLTNRWFERQIVGAFSDCRVTSARSGLGGHAVEVQLRGTTQDEVRSSSGEVWGEGDGPTEAAALEAARRDAVLSLGSRVKLHDCRMSGSDLKTDSEVDAQGYLEYSVLSTKRTTEGWHVKLKGAVVQPNTRISPKDGRWGIGAMDDGLLMASIRARTDAIIDAGSTYSVKRKLKNGVLLAEHVEKKREGRVNGFVFKESSQGDLPVIAAQLVSGSKDGRECTGYGEGKTEREAVIAARYDAVLNGGCLVSARERHTKETRDAESLELNGEGFVGAVRILSMKRTATGYGACVGARVWNGLKAPGTPTRIEASGIGQGASLAGALAAAKAELAFNAGTWLQVHNLRYENLKKASVDLAGTLSAASDSYEIVEAARTGNHYRVTVKGGLLYGPRSSVAPGMLVTGWGYGRTPEAAALVAKAEAALNARGEVHVDSQWDSKGTSIPRLNGSWKGSVHLLDESDAPAIDKGIDGMCRARVSLKAYANFPQNERITVRAHGRGTNISTAIKEAHENIGLNAGARVEATVAVQRDGDGEIRWKWSNDVAFTAFKVEKIEREGNAYIVRVSGSVVRDSRHYADSPNAPVAGIGYAATPNEAFKQARRSALLDNGGRGRFSAEYVGSTRRTFTGEFDGSAELRFRDQEIERAEDGGYKATARSEMLPYSRQKLEPLKQKVDAYGFGQTEDEAVNAAKDNAIASVFGRSITLAGGEKLSDEGVVESYKVKKVEAVPCGLQRVEIVAEVRSRDYKEHSSWWWSVLVFFIVCAFLGAAKEKGTGWFALAWIITLVGLFLTGHWIWGILLLIGGIGILKDS